MLISFICVMSLMFIHELGHYVMAYKFGWNPKLSVGMYKKYMPCMMVSTKFNTSIKTEKDFMKVYSQLTAFSMMGLLFPLLAIYLFRILGVFTLSVSFLLLSVFVVYGIYEVSTPTMSLKIECENFE